MISISISGAKLTTRVSRERNWNLNALGKLKAISGELFELSTGISLALTEIFDVDAVY